MARGEILSAQVESIAAGGAGITRLGGKVVLINLTAPGDRIKYRITNEKKTWAQGELLEILEASPQRIEPVCRHYGLCGGCSLQHLAYEAQIEAKTAILRSAFERIGRINTPIIRVIRSAPFEYRNRIRFHIIQGADGELKGRPGFMERGSTRLVAVDDCPVADAGIRKALKKGDFLPSGNYKYLNVFSSGNTFLLEGGQERSGVSILGRELIMDLKVFFQSNTAVLELLIGDLLQIAETSDKNLPLADIYSGVGTFSSFLGSEFQKIDLVEENRVALDLARENMPKGKKVNYFAMTDTAWVKIIEKINKKSWGFMVLDPPRSGLSAPLRKWLAQKGPALAAYVSCDPATAARDGRILVEGGYTLKELTLYDFYPQTAHIESLAVFSREAQ